MVLAVVMPERARYAENRMVAFSAGLKPARSHYEQSLHEHLHILEEWSYDWPYLY